MRATPSARASSPAGGDESTRPQAVENTAVREIERRDVAARGGAIGRDASRSPSQFSLSVRCNGQVRLVPVVADSLDRLVPLAEALELAASGFEATLVRAPWPALRVVLSGLVDPRAARRRIEAHKAELLGRLTDALPREQRRLEPGLSLDVLAPAPERLEVLIRPDAPGSRCPALHELAPSARAALVALAMGEARSEPCELSFERVRVGCSLEPAQLADASTRSNPVRLASSVKRALRFLDFALSSPRTAATQNQAVFGAISRVVLALGHDPRGVLSEGQTYAARFGGCTSVVKFAAEGERIRAELELPLQLEPRDPTSAPPLATTPVEGDELRLLAGCIGLASQLPTLRAAILQ